MRTAVLLGATGLVGGHCLRALLDSPQYGRVITLGRRPTKAASPKLVEHVFDFERIAEQSELLEADDVFYCLGTTLAQAGSREAFRRVDFDYPTRIAQAAQGAGVRRWMMISSVGASPRSPFFYLRVKGEAEEAIARSGISQIHFFRPSLLLGARPGHRALEQAAIPVVRALSPLLCGPLSRYRPVEAGEVARRMLEAALEERAGVRIHEGT
jgi:uncharacterized protein YbjT (DUF2867 family)